MRRFRRTYAVAYFSPSFIAAAEAHFTANKVFPRADVSAFAVTMPVYLHVIYSDTSEYICWGLI